MSGYGDRAKRATTRDCPTNKLNTPFLKEKNKKYVLGYMKLKICFRENI